MKSKPKPREDQMWGLSILGRKIGKPMTLLLAEKVNDSNNPIVGYSQDHKGNVDGLNLRNCNLPKIPQEIQCFKNLKKLWLDNNQITKIENLDGLEELRVLGLGNNQIGEIENLKNLSGLEELELNNNKITEIKNLECLINLSKLKLYNNDITEIKSLDKLTNLQQLGLYNNNIAKIQNLDGLVNLTRLGLGCNKIKKIEGLDKLKGLKILWLYNNKITKIENLNKLANLKTLWLDNNQITKIENLDGLEELCVLGLNNNKIKTIQNLNKLIGLQSLMLNKNLIKKIESLDTLKNLQTLELYDNKLETFENLDNLKSLIVLGIKNNPFERKGEEKEKCARFQNGIKTRKLPEKILISKLGNIEIETAAPDMVRTYTVTSGSSEQKDPELYLDKDKAMEKARSFMYDKLVQELEKSFHSENVVLLTGSGTSIGYGGSTMAGLWKAVKKDGELAKIRKWDDLLKLARYGNSPEEESLEELLSRLHDILNAHNTKETTKKYLKKAVEAIEKRILLECRKIVLSNSEPKEQKKTPAHVEFLKKIFKERGDLSRCLKVFTLNYDTAFEQAGDEIDAVVIDGFSFSHKQKFKSTQFNFDIIQNYKQGIKHHNKVFQLYKLHGSVDWRRNGDGEIVKDEKTDVAVLIYPHSSKFKKIFQLPYYGMFANFQNSLLNEKTTLFIIGYGFMDEHINDAISEAIEHNPDLEIFVINPSLDNKNLNDYRKKVSDGAKNIHLIKNTFGEFSIAFCQTEK